MKKVIVALLAFLVVSSGAYGLAGFLHRKPEVKPYLAVFTSPEFEWMWLEGHEHPDKLVVAEGWANFDDFCKEVEKDAKGRPILIDLTVHGNDSGLAVSTDYFMSETSVGYVVNTIEECVPSKNLTVLLEACYPGNAYYYSIRNPQNSEELNHKGPPKFPIYGVGSGYSNWGITVYLQYKYKTYKYFEDLRNYEQKLPLIHEKEDSVGISPTTRELMILFFRLYSLKG